MFQLSGFYCRGILGCEGLVARLLGAYGSLTPCHPRLPGGAELEPKIREGVFCRFLVGAFIGLL